MGLMAPTPGTPGFFSIGRGSAAVAPGGLGSAGAARGGASRGRAPEVAASPILERMGAAGAVEELGAAIWAGAEVIVASPLLSRGAASEDECLSRSRADASRFTCDDARGGRESSLPFFNPPPPSRSSSS